MQEVDNKIQTITPKRRSVWKITRNIILGFLLFILLTLLLLRITIVQTFLANQFSQYLSEKTNTEIRIGRLDISGFLRINLFDLYAIDQEDSVMIDSKQISIDLELFALFNNELHINHLYIDSTYFALFENQQDSILNLISIIDFFGSGDTSSTEANISVKVDRLDIRGAHFRMDLWSAASFDDGGMDYTNLDVDNIDIVITDFHTDGDTLIGNMAHFNAIEKCGFNLQQFTGLISLSSKALIINNLELKANSSWAYADFKMKYNEWPDWLEFITNVRFKTHLDSAQLNLEDIQFFAPSMKGMQDTLRFSGDIRGPIDNLKLRKGRVYYKNKTQFIGDITMTGLPDIEHSFMLIKAKNISTNYQDLSSFYLPGKERLFIPDIIKNLGEIEITGRFTGFYNDFVSNAHYKTKLGILTTDILLKPYHNQSHEIEYHGQLTTKRFNLGGLFGQNKLTNLNMEARIDGVGIDKNAIATYSIEISSTSISNYEYKDVTIDGKIENQRIDAELLSTAGDFILTANGYYDYHDTLPEYKLYMDMKDAQIGRLFLLDKDTLGRISGILNMEMQGDNLDNISGSILIDSLIYSVDNTSYEGDRFSLVTNTDNKQKRNITLRSKWLDADINGQFIFSEFELMYRVIFKDILPSVIKSWGLKDVYEIDRSIVRENDNISFSFEFNSPEDLNRIFLPKSQLGKGTLIDGYFNLDHDSMNLKIYAPTISYEDYYAENLSIIINKPPNELNLTIDVEYLHAKNIFALDSVYINSNIRNDTVIYFASWGAKENHFNTGYFGGEVIWQGTDSLVIGFAPGEFWLNDTLWRLSEKGVIHTSHHYLSIRDFNIYSNNNKFEIDGSLSEKPNDIMKVKFNNFDLSLLDFYLKEKYSTDLDGRLTGHFELSNIWTKVGFTSQMDIAGFYLNNSYLGDAKAHSSYSRSRKAFVVDIVLENPKDSIPIKYLDLGGFYYPNRKENNFDLDLYFNHYPLTSLHTYLTSFTSDIDGYLDGKLSIDGSIKEPLISGYVDANVPKLKIDYIGETYHFNDKLVFKKDYFGLDKIYIYDSEFSGGEQHRALADIQIRHDNYSNFELYVDIKPEKLKVLNLDQNEDALFYGKAKANGNFKLFGPFNKLSLRMNAESLDGSKISIPFSSESTAEEADFITFIKKDDSLQTNENSEKTKDDFSIDMDMTIKVNSGTQMEIVMDEVVGDRITAKGNGSIQLIYDRYDNFLMYGKYIIERGDYLFTMQNIINKHFFIEPGGYLEWDGDPEQAVINVKAIYKTEAKLYDLIQQVETSEEYKKRASKVECIISITGNIYNPSVKFDIKVPEESSSVRELVKQLLTIDGSENGSQEMNKNFISLLVLSRFLPPSGYDSGTNPNAISKNATELAANQIGNVLNKLSDEVEIGFNWNPGDDLTTQEVAIALSYSMLDDRLAIDGKFGTGGGSNEPESAQRIVGDLNVEYKFTKDGRVRGKVFNRTNYYDPLTKRAPYTQGVGIAYRKEFDNLYELFHRTKSEEEQIKRSEAAAKYRKQQRKLEKEKKKKKKEEKKKKRSENEKARKPETEVEIKKEPS